MNQNPEEVWFLHTIKMTYVSSTSAICVKVDRNIEFFVKAKLRCRPKCHIFLPLR